MKLIIKYLKLNLRIVYFSLFKIIRLFKNSSSELYAFYIHPSVKIGKKVIIKKYCNISRDIMIGDYTFINEYTRIDSSIHKIGKYCSISHNVKIGMIPHPSTYISTSPVFYSTSRSFIKKDLFVYNKKNNIGNDVFIASNAIILAGVEISDGAIIAAGSVVTKDVPPYAIVAGNPAKIIKYRFSKSEIEKLLKYKWWDKDISFLVEHATEMAEKESFFTMIE